MYKKSLNVKAAIFLALVLITKTAFPALATDNAIYTTEFSESVFYSPNFFYLGAYDTGYGAYALSRAYIQEVTSNDTTVRSIQLQTLAPSQAYVNPSTTAGSPSSKQANPIYTANIVSLTLQGMYPIALLGTRNPSYTDAGTTGANQNICKVTETAEGTRVLTNATKLNDANSQPTAGISLVEGSSTKIFAAVSPSGGTFGDDDSGIAVVQQNTIDYSAENRPPMKLEPIDATTGNSGNKAVDVNGAASPTPANITLTSNVAMHWDPQLARLYVGIEGKVDSAGGTLISGLLVGRLEDSKLILESAINDTATVIGTNEDVDKIVSFYKSTAPDNYVSINKIATMHTSTRKSYVIVVGNIYNNIGSVIKTEVHALPVMRNQYTNSTFARNNQSLVGKIAKKDSTSQEEAPTQLSHLPTNLDELTHVGGGAQGAAVNDTPDDVQNIFVRGDTIYVSCAHAADKDKQGVFRSTAVFDENGLIRSWTPWQRAIGSAEKVTNVAVDNSTGEFWFLAENIHPNDTVKVTQWRMSDNTLLGTLFSALSTTYPQTDGGIHQLFNFDTLTAGLYDNEFSMMVATGKTKISLIRTGKLSGGLFVPTGGTDFSGASLSDNVKTIDATTQAIGPICCAEISRSSAHDEGWLFVGGKSGVAVLSKDDGTGWTDIENLTTDLTGFTLKKIGSFTNVHKLVCDGTYLYIMTPQVLYRVAMDADKFKLTSPDDLGAEIVARPTYTNMPTCDQYDYFLDFIVSSKVGILATTSGLYRTADEKNIASATLADAQSWTQVTSYSGYNLGPITHLFVQSRAKGSFGAGGNLYVTAGNMSTDLTAIVRFDVADTSASAIDDAIKPIAEAKESATSTDRNHYYAFGELRNIFTSNGTFAYHILSKHFDYTTIAKKFNQTSEQSSVRGTDVSLPLNLKASAYNGSIPVENSASGAWIVPGDWVARINE